MKLDQHWTAAMFSLGIHVSNDTWYNICILLCMKHRMNDEHFIRGMNLGHQLENYFQKKFFRFLKSFSYNFPIQQWPFVPLSDSTKRENQRKEKNGILVLFPSWNETSLEFTRDPSRFNEVFFLFFFLFFCSFLFHIQKRKVNSLNIAIMA